jgi:hypothetical protein
MKNITPALTLIALTAAASAQTTPAYGAKSTALNYDRVSVSYSQNDNYNGVGVTGMASLGQYLLIGMNRTDLSGRGALSDFDINGVSGMIGAKFSAGPGDLYVYYSYGQVEGGATSAPFVALLSGETSSYTVGYRIALSSAFELNASVSRTKSTAGVAVFNTGAGTYTSSATNDSSTDWGISARYNINKNFDVFAGYEFAGGDLGLNTWYSGLGISF